VDYVLKPSNGSSDWPNHFFYKEAVVLGIDIGIRGIGVWLRKGPAPLFAQTYLVNVPEAAPLEARRQKRAQRRARKSAKIREKKLRAWIVKYGLLTSAEVDSMWKNTNAFQTAHEHRHRVVNEGKKLASPQALVSVLRQLVNKRGYDYHMTEEGKFPWGDSTDSKEIIKWAKWSWVEQKAVTEWKKQISDLTDSPDDKAHLDIYAALDEAVERSKHNTLEQRLAEHMKERRPNLRQPLRGTGNNFPREAIKRHARHILQKHSDMFKDPSAFSQAIKEFLGEKDNICYEHPGSGSIIDFHRRSTESVKQLWERKTSDCPYISRFRDLGLSSTKIAKCSLNSDPYVQQWKLLSFLSERTFVDSANVRRPLTADLLKHILDVQKEIIEARTAKKSPPKILLDSIFSEYLSKEIPLKDSKGKIKKITLRKKDQMNKDFLDQLKDILKPKSGVLKKRSGLCSESARLLFDQGTKKSTIFEPEQIRINLADSFYQWRRNNTSQAPGYPQVEFLMGSTSHYDDQGRPRDLNGRGDGRPQHHGVLRRLFHNQLKDAHGNQVDLLKELGGKECPDFVIVEVIGEIPRNTEQRKLIQADQKSRKEVKSEITHRFGEKLSSSQIRKVFLFEQQCNDEGLAFCPLTGTSLGKDPLATQLEISHIFPQDSGGISEMDNLFITIREINSEMGKRTPRMVADKTSSKIKFLSFDEMEKISSRFKWNKRKRILFEHQGSDVPDFGNLTRQSQLARQLRREVVRWLGIEQKHKNSKTSDRDIALETFQRIGTPTGFMTSICRDSWQDMLPEFMKDKKNRGNLRHHLYDAAVVSFIPPGAGMNNVHCGGIFTFGLQKDGTLKGKVLEGLLPDLNDFELKHQRVCLVNKPRQKKSKSKRTEETIYNLPDADPLKEGKLRARVEIDAEKLKASDFSENQTKIPSSQLPLKVIAKWFDAKGAKPLHLGDGTEVKHIMQMGNQQALSSLVAHRNHENKLIGCKIFTEKFLTCEIWKGTKKAKDGKPALDAKGKSIPVYRSVLIPPARNLRSFEKLFGKKWAPEEKLDSDFKKIGQIQKGDVFRIPLDAKGDVCDPEVKPTYEAFYRPTAIKSSGQISFDLAEHINSVPAQLAHLKGVEQTKPSAPAKLAAIILNNTGILRG